MKNIIIRTVMVLVMTALVSCGSPQKPSFEGKRFVYQAPPDTFIFEFDPVDLIRLVGNTR